MTIQSQTSRRLFLAAGSAATVFCVSTQTVAQAPMDVDPIFAAIERHRAAWSDAADMRDEARLSGRATEDHEAVYAAAALRAERGAQS